MFDFIKNISPVELGIIIIILIVLFGNKIITRLARSSGETVKEIKNIKKEFTRSVEGDNKSSSKN